MREKHHKIYILLEVIFTIQIDPTHISIRTSTKGGMARYKKTFEREIPTKTHSRGNEESRIGQSVQIQLSF